VSPYSASIHIHKIERNSQVCIGVTCAGLVLNCLKETDLNILVLRMKLIYSNV